LKKHFFRGFLRKTPEKNKKWYLKILFPDAPSGQRRMIFSEKRNWIKPSNILFLTI